MPQYLRSCQPVESKLPNEVNAAFVHLGDVLSTECVDNTSDGRSLALADEIEVKHALHGSCLEAAVASSV